MWNLVSFLVSETEVFFNAYFWSTKKTLCYIILLLLDSLNAFLNFFCLRTKVKLHTHMNIRSLSGQRCHIQRRWTIWGTLKSSRSKHWNDASLPFYTKSAFYGSSNEDHVSLVPPIGSVVVTKQYAWEKSLAFRRKQCRPVCQAYVYSVFLVCLHIFSCACPNTITYVLHTWILGNYN